FLGFQENIPKLIEAFDIALVPSRQEPFGIVAVEFMQAKIPLVCSAADGLAELVTHQHTALVPPQNKPAPLCQTIEQLWQDDSLRKKLVDSACEYAQKFSIKTYVEKLNKVYDHLINEDATS
ncbi:MAG: glycosyltransferase family 4 protein, partial [Planctomycetes bacterium]|nr:glycosyltransferase family 4 protein [Planctomycetota bacterium]